MSVRWATFAPDVSSEAYSHLIESWHEFYLMAGTASVTLVGLLFVAISIHLDVVLHHKRAHLLDLSRQTLLAYLYVLIISLMFLVPPSAPRMLAANVGLPSLVVLILAIVGLIREAAQKETAVPRRSLIRRRMVQIAALTVAVFAAHLLWIGDGYGAFMMIAPVCMMLGNATGSAWDLLVQLGRLKAQDDAAVT